MAAVNGGAALVNFRTPPTVGQFMLDTKFVRLIMGPVGSGKSAGCFMELLRRAHLQEPDNQGVRRTRFAIIRNTLQQLRQTCLADIQLWLSSVAHFRVTDQTVQIRLNMKDGTKIESDWMLIPLDTKQDQQRLLSLNLTGAWVSEFREIPLEIIDALSGRCGRYPSKAIAKPSWYGIIAESNPPDEDSEWYTKLELELPPNWSFFKQPGGLSEFAENVENLPENYYPNLAANNNPDWVDIHVHAKYGKSLSGQAVFRATFSPIRHVTYEGIKRVEGMSIMIGQDFGRTPASLIGQIDNRGRLVILHEAATQPEDAMGIEKFGKEILRPMLYQHYANCEIYMIGDPSGKIKTQVREESPFDMLHRLGFIVYPAPTNDLEPRLRAVEQLFLQHDGLLIDGVNCPQLVQALKSWYRYKRKQTGTLDETPEKNHPWSDLADCLQYMALAAHGNYIGNLISRKRPRPKGPPITAGSWT
jgi:hypothetical protein